MTELEIRPYGHTLFFTCDKEAFLTKRSAYTEIPFDLEGTTGCSSDFGAITHVMGVFDGKTETLAHEVAHVCIKVLEYSGVPITRESSEAFCYLLSDLLEKLTPHLVIAESTQCELSSE